MRAPPTLVSLLAALAAGLALAAPAAAAPEDAVVGDPIVVTDPAGQTEPDASEDPAVDEGPEPESDDVPAPEPDASGKRGELHVLGTDTASSPATAAPASGSGAAPGGTLPFTGVDAWVLALSGLALLAGGFAVRRVTPPASRTRPGPR